MNLPNNPYVLPVLLGAIVSVFVAVFTWRRRPARGATPAALVMAGIAVWCLGFTFELVSPDLPGKIFWAKFEYFGVATVPLAWFAFALEYTGHERFWSRRKIVLLALIPLFTLVLVWTNELHGLFWSRFELDTELGFVMSNRTRNIGFYINWIYAYALLLPSAILLFRWLAQSKFLYRRQAVVVVIATVAPWIGNFLFVTGLDPFPRLDLTLLGFVVSSVAMALGLYRYRLLDLVPIAQDKVIENMQDAVLVLDAQNRIVNANPAVQSLLGLDAKSVIGRNAAEVFSEYPEWSKQFRNVFDTHTEITCGTGSGQRWLELRISSLRVHHPGQLDGQVLVLRDITERKRSEQELERLNTDLQAELAERKQAQAALQELNNELEHRVAKRTADLTRANETLRVEIEEHKRTEVALRESETQYRSLFENSVMGISQTLPDGHFVGANAACAQMYGYANPEQMMAEVTHIGQQLYANPEDRKEILRILKENGVMEPREIEFVRRDGSQFYALLGAREICDANGNLLYYQAEYVDITARKRAEEELLVSEMRYRRLFEAAKDGILILDADTGEIVEVNPFLIEMLGYSHAEFLGKQLWEIGLFKDIVASKSSFAKLRAQGYIRYENLPLATQDGRSISVEFVSNVYAVGEKQVIQCNIRDITARKRAEEALRESEEHYRILAENMSDTVWLMDMNLQTIYISPSVIRVRGYTLDELNVLPLDQQMTPDSLTLAMELFAEALSPENLQRPDPRTTYSVELEFYRKDGGKFWSENTFTLILDQNKQPINILGAGRDITERKRAEEALRQRLTELETVHNVSTALRTAQTRDEALPILLDKTLTALETDAGAICLYHPDKDELRNAIARGWFRQFDDIPMKPGEGIVGTVYATGQAHITTEFKSDPIVRQHIAPAGWGGVCLPIHAGPIMVGALTIALPPPRQITPEQVQVLDSLSEMAGTTLHRMSLHDETVRQLDRLGALHSIDSAITANTDLRMTLNILLEHVKAQLNADATGVLLLNPYTETLEYAAGLGFRTRAAQTAHIRLGESFAGRIALERRTVRVDDLAQIRASPHFAALWAGEGFATYFGVPLVAKGQVKGVLEIYHRAPFHPEPDWISFLEMLAGQAAIAIDNAQLFENLENSNTELMLAYDSTIEGWSQALELRDNETEWHTLRVTEITLRLAKAMGIGDPELVHIRRGALLHDIGKMGVPDSILLKPGKLTNEEWVIMRQHPQLAFNLISPIYYLRPALDIPYCHHEKWDGTGYPRGLKGAQIPLAARIFAVVDVWDALRSDRPYRKAWAEEQVLEYIRSQAGTHFDPDVVKVCLESGVLGTLAPE